MSLTCNTTLYMFFLRIILSFCPYTFYTIHYTPYTIQKKLTFFLTKFLIGVQEQGGGQGDFDNVQMGADLFWG